MELQTLIFIFYTLYRGRYFYMEPNISINFYIFLS